MDTPVLIPNTEVKHISGDNIWTGSSEDSTLPGNLTHLTMGLFLFCVFCSICGLCALGNSLHFLLP